MKVVYFNMDEEKLFDVKVDVLESIPEENLIKDIPEIDNEYKKVLDYVNEEIFIFIPIDDGEDFYLRYFNHVNYFNENDYNFKIGSRLSQTIARDDKKGNLFHVSRILAIFQSAKLHEILKGSTR